MEERIKRSKNEVNNINFSKNILVLFLVSKIKEIIINFKINTGVEKKNVIGKARHGRHGRPCL